MTNKYDEIEKNNPYRHMRYGTGPKLLLTGSNPGKHPTINLKDGFDLVEDSDNYNDQFGGSFALKTRASKQYYTLPNQAFTGSIHKVVEFTSGSERFSGDFTLSNLIDFDNNKIIFPEQNQLYMLRLEGIVPTADINQNQYLHFDLAESGSINTQMAIGIHSHDNQTSNRQSQDFFIAVKGAQEADHVHVHAIYHLFVDEDLYVSGVQFYGATSLNGVEFKSGSLFIIKT